MKEKREIDYTKVNIPEGKDPKKYSYIERRAEILKLIVEAGHPDLISQTQLAKRYGVSQPQISKDITAIKKQIHNSLKGEMDLLNYVVFTKAIKKLMKEGKVIESYKILKEWNDWLFRRGIEREAPRRYEISQKIPTPQEVLDEIERREKQKNEK